MGKAVFEGGGVVGAPTHVAPAQRAKAMADAIAGYAFAGAWLALVLRVCGFVALGQAAPVSFGLAALGALAGVELVMRNRRR